MDPGTFKPRLAPGSPMREASILLSVMLVTGALALPAGADEHLNPDAGCGPGAEGAVMEDLDHTSGGEQLHACLAYPAAGEATVERLVVVAHGLGWTVQAGWSHHMVEIVERTDATAVVATNYRDNFQFPAMQGAEDTVRVTQLAQERFSSVEETILVGVSMGGTISGTALHIAPELAGEGLYDHWFDLEGLTNLFESYAEARAVGVAVPFAADVADDIEDDAGGTPAEVPQAYVERSPALNAEAMAAAGLESAVVVHAVNDGLVPYDQAREMADALVDAGVPVELHTILRDGPDQTSGTTPTSHALDPSEDPNEQHLDLAGHASEADRGHPVMDVGLERLIGLLGGDSVDAAYAEAIHDAGAGSAGTTG